MRKLLVSLNYPAQKTWAWYLLLVLVDVSRTLCLCSRDFSLKSSFLQLFVHCLLKLCWAFPHSNSHLVQIFQLVCDFLVTSFRLFIAVISDWLLHRMFIGQNSIIHYYSVIQVHTDLVRSSCQYATGHSITEPFHSEGSSKNSLICAVEYR